MLDELASQYGIAQDQVNAELVRIKRRSRPWTAKGTCRTTDTATLFEQRAAQHRAKAICMSCPVRTEFLVGALDNRIEFGVWGGMTERERRALLRRRPNVESWRVLLESARAEHERVLEIAAARTEQRIRDIKRTQTEEGGLRKPQATSAHAAPRPPDLGPLG